MGIFRNRFRCFATPGLDAVFRLFPGHPGEGAGDHEDLAGQAPYRRGRRGIEAVYGGDAGGFQFGEKTFVCRFPEEAGDAPGGFRTEIADGRQFIGVGVG